MTPQTFNLYEGLFWLALAASCLVALSYVPLYLKSWLYFSAGNLFLFGLSDFVEMYTGGFLHTASWLLVWKSVCVVGLVVSVVWYFYVRLVNK
jgi:hypothetical protein